LLSSSGLTLGASLSIVSLAEGAPVDFESPSYIKYGRSIRGFKNVIASSIGVEAIDK
jgi:hypothetical protein